MSNIIRVLSRHNIPLTDTLLNEAYDWAVEQEADVKDLLTEEIGEAMVLAVTSQQID